MLSLGIFSDICNAVRIFPRLTPNPDLRHMAKLNSLLTGSGKIGNLILASTAGETIARQYQPNVSNPSSAAQVDQRASFKLMSQLAADLAPSIAIPKRGLVSSRNAFVRKNFPSVTATNGVAQVIYENLQLTEGTRSLPDVTASVAAGTLSVGMAATPNNVDSVAYHAYSVNEEGSLEFINSVVSPASANYAATIPNVPQGDVVVFAYGVVATNDAGRAKYGRYNVQNGSDLARLIANRTLTTSDIITTRTRSQVANSAITSNISVFATAGNGGSVSGAGAYPDGTRVLLQAAPDAGMQVNEWLDANGNVIARYTPTLPVVVNGQIVDVTVTFRTAASGDDYFVQASAANALIIEGPDNYITDARVSVNGEVQAFPYSDDDTNPGFVYDFVAQPVDGYTFSGWYISGATLNGSPLLLTDAPELRYTLGSQNVGNLIALYTRAA